MGPDTGLRYERDMGRDMVCQHISIAFSISRPYRKRARRHFGSVPISQAVSGRRIGAHIVWYRDPYRVGIATISVSYRMAVAGYNAIVYEDYVQVSVTGALPLGPLVRGPHTTKP